ncbi:MAG: Molybdopterin dehydrogenase, FAD-binding protein [uncultured bacterium]|nr:MAG: Molybdopterin dehydrogenase, FAD-binding protein [uncultured bacterium]HBD04851.1 hypothetical protein [Candidatus Uhrbacteria bacterium]
MLPLPNFQVHRATTVSGALELKARLGDSKFVAGGTDLLPNLKNGLYNTAHVIDLGGCRDLEGIEHQADGTIIIGSMTTLADIEASPAIRQHASALAVASELVASPQIRSRATLGGNIMLDTRCRYYNQSRFWRESLGGCLKLDGNTCRVTGSKTACMAARSSDTVPILIALGAQLVIELPEMVNWIPVCDLFGKDGRFEACFNIDQNALVSSVKIPAPKPGQRSVYRKVRTRNAIDFPQLGLAIAGVFEDCICTGLVAVVGAVNPRPKILQGMDIAVGTRLEDCIVEKLAESAFKQINPLANIAGDPAWRREMVRVEMRRGLKELRDQQG